MADRVGSQQMNLTAVRRHDPYVADIVDSATQVAVYEYSSEASEWQKTDMQGAMFVYKRSGPPYHSFMVLNRLNTSNLLQPLTSELEFQLQAPFLLYRTSQGIIYGLWFFYEHECKKMAGLLENLCQSTAGSSASAAPGSNKTSVDLLTLFKSASGPQPRASPQQQQQQQTPQKPTKQQKQQSTAAAGSGSRPETPRAAAEDPPPPQQSGQITIADLFAKASRTGQVLIGKQTVRSISVSEVEDAMPDLGGRPRLPAQPPPPPPPPPPPVISAVPAAGAAAVRPTAPVREAESRDVDRIQELFKTNLQLGGPEPAAPAPAPAPAAQHSAVLAAAPPDLTATAGSGLSVPLMSPMMFSALPPPGVELGSSPAAGERSVAAAGPSPLLTEPPATGEGDLAEVTPLTRRQLLQAFTYLIKNDEAFVGQLHQAYVKSLTESFRKS